MIPITDQDLSGRKHQHIHTASDVYTSKGVPLEEIGYCATDITLVEAIAEWANGHAVPFSGDFTTATAKVLQKSPFLYDGRVAYNPLPPNGHNRPPILPAGQSAAEVTQGHPIGSADVVFRDCRFETPSEPSGTTIGQVCTRHPGREWADCQETVEVAFRPGAISIAPVGTDPRDVDQWQRIGPGHWIEQRPAGSASDSPLETITIWSIEVRGDWTVESE